MLSFGGWEGIFRTVNSIQASNLMEKGGAWVCKEGLPPSDISDGKREDRYVRKGYDGEGVG